YGTVFGDVGGANKIKAENFTVNASSGTFNVGGASNGKFASSTEGMAAIFMQIDAKKDFTAEVTATVSASGDKQSSFGLMLRDDIYIDTYDPTIMSNYVSAGILNGGAVFAMKDEQRSSTVGSATISTSSTYTLKIKKNGNSITATVIQGSTTVTNTYDDVYLNISDEGNVYLCMYAIRNIVATFTNVSVTIND
ncbi:MAG: hypothetical protein K2O62_02315, partial [Clostridia bacterium]|nr:hypothetical protein [Clostridia bacterium]